VIERTFGVLKKRFKILSFAQPYSLHNQARLPSALAVIHNFIMIYDPSDDDFVEDDGNQVQGEIRRTEEHVISQEERGRAAERREQIAQAMWRNYEHRN
jgi:hypothetical protein